MDVCNLGFGGGATLEAEMAEWIVSRKDWHLATLEMGVNVLDLPTADFRLKVRKFLSFFAADPLKRPVYTLDLLLTSGEFSGNETAIKKCADFRRIVHEETLAAGESHLHVLEYSSLLKHASDFSTDLIHPAAHTFEKIGCGLAAQISKSNPLHH
ncbi:MAG: hypothetical protein J6S58_05345 [Lentisphaeria bacterium]|nr:hypothetical protein [Lentisphaeria bacterium]